MKNKSSKKTIIGIVLGIILAILALLVIFLLIKSSKKEYTIVFDSNGGSIVESVKVKENGHIAKPNDPTKEGYTFAGWYLDDELFDFNTKINKSIVLEAYWNTENGLKIKELSLVIGSTQKLEILSLPDGLSEKDLIYSSSDESVATIDKNGNLIAIKKGTVTITVNKFAEAKTITVKSKDGKYSATCKVAITEKEIEIESVSISGSSSVTVGSSIKLSATFNPDNATIQKLTWKSSDESIATVDANGNVKGLKAGTVTITVTTENGKTATKKITIKEKSTSHNNGGSSGSGNDTPTVEPTSVDISGNKEVYVGDSIQLSATVSPRNGKVTGVSAGTVNITVTTANGKSTTYEVKVKEKQSTYIIYITQRELEVAGGAIQYDFRVEKDGTTFTDYRGFDFNGTLISKGQGSISSTVVKKGGTSAQLTLSDGSKVSAQVKIS